MRNHRLPRIQRNVEAEASGQVTDQRDLLALGRGGERLVRLGTDGAMQLDEVEAGGALMPDGTVGLLNSLCIRFPDVEPAGEDRGAEDLASGNFAAQLDMLGESEQVHHRGHALGDELTQEEGIVLGVEDVGQVDVGVGEPGYQPLVAAVYASGAAWNRGGRAWSYE